MAYVSQLKKDDENQNQGMSLTGGQQTSGESGVISGSGGASQPSGPTGGQQQAATTPQKKGGSSGWTNLSTYRDANINNDRNMARAIGDTQSKEKKQVADAYGRLRGDVSSGISQGNLSDQDIGIMKSRLSTAPSTVSQEDFSKYYNYAYGGPGSIEEVGSYQDTRKELGDLDRISEQTKNYRGVADLLNETYGKDATYNRGQNILDAFITQSGEKGQRALGDIRRDFANLSGKYQDLDSTLNQQIGAARDYANKQGADFRQNVNTNYDQMLNNVGKYQAEMNDVLSSGIGRTGDTLSRDMFGTDELRNYQELGSSQDAKLRALSELMGKQYQGVDFNTLANDLLATEQAKLDQQYNAEIQRMAEAEARRAAAERFNREIEAQAANAGFIESDSDPNSQDVTNTQGDQLVEYIFSNPIDRAETTVNNDPVTKTINDALTGGGGGWSW